MNQLFLAGRLLAGGFYLFNAFNHFANAGAMSAYAAARGVPMPTLLIIASGVLLAIAGFSFLLGIVPRVGVAALVVFLVPVTLVMHSFWADTNPIMRMMNATNFAKNVALLGSGLMFLAVPEPWPLSIESALRRRERRQTLTATP